VPSLYLILLYFFRYMYLGEVEVRKDELDTLLSHALDMKIKGLMTEERNEKTSNDLDQEETPFALPPSMESRGKKRPAETVTSQTVEGTNGRMDEDKIHSSRHIHKSEFRRQMSGNYYILR
jgi:uncharacterized protein with WD repeat